MASTPFEDSAPSAGLAPPGARAAPTRIAARRVSGRRSFLSSPQAGPRLRTLPCPLPGVHLSELCAKKLSLVGGGALWWAHVVAVTGEARRPREGRWVGGKEAVRPEAAWWRLFGSGRRACGMWRDVGCGWVGGGGAWCQWGGR